MNADGSGVPDVVPDVMDVVHRLGTVAAVAAALGLPVWRLLAVRRVRRVRRRTASLLAGSSAVHPPPVADGSSGAKPAGRLPVSPASVRQRVPAVAVAGAAWMLVGGPAGAVTGLACGAGLWWWQQRSGIRPRPEAEVDAAEAARQLPLAADLLAACIAAGAGPVIAAQAVGEALGGPVGEALARGAAEVRLGGADDAWRGLAAIPGAAALARLLERAGESGFPAAVPAARLAADVRADRGRTATARARRAAVLVTAPVGLCFLPAFVAIGVLPVVIGLAGGVWRGGGG
nr:type II secretion system F family protein [Streptomyces sp. Tu 6176]